jgi:hypothetical protein
MIQPRKALLKALNNIKNPRELSTVQDTRDSQRTAKLLKKKKFPLELKPVLDALDQQIDARIQDLEKQLSHITRNESMINARIKRREELLYQLQHINPIEVDDVQHPRNLKHTARIRHEEFPQELVAKLDTLDQQLDAEFTRLRAEPSYIAHMSSIIKERFTQPKLDEVTSQLHQAELILKNMKSKPPPLVLQSDMDNAQAHVTVLTKQQDEHVVFQGLQKRVQQSEAYLEQLNTSNLLDHPKITDTRNKDPLPFPQMPEGTQEGRMESILRNDLEQLDKQIEAKGNVKAKLQEVDKFFNRLEKHLEKAPKKLDDYNLYNPDASQDVCTDAKASLQQLHETLTQHKKEYVAYLKTEPDSKQVPYTLKKFQTVCAKTTLHFEEEILFNAKQKMPQNNFEEFQSFIQGVYKQISTYIREIGSRSKPEEPTPEAQVTPSKAYKAKLQEFISAQQPNQEDDKKNEKPSQRGSNSPLKPQ